MKSKFFLLCRKVLVLPLVSILLTLPVIAQKASDEYLQGKRDGEMDAKGNPVWFVGGLVCGLFAVLYCLGIESPTPPSSALVGKSSDYVLGYTEGYRSKTRQKDAVYAAAGWAAGLVIYAALILPVGGETTY